jgi:hypothetical protein
MTTLARESRFLDFLDRRLIDAAVLGAFVVGWVVGRMMS